MEERPQSYAEANAELASAMQAVEEANASFFAAFKLAEPLLRAEPLCDALIARWDEWNSKRKCRDRLRETFRARFHKSA